MKVEDLKDGKFITLSKGFDTRPKILNFIYFLAFSGAGIWFIILIAPDAYTDQGALVFLLVFGGVYLFAGKRFLNKALQKETVFITRDVLKISRSGFFTQTSHSYDPKFISEFSFVDKSETTRHPLAGDTFDYLGFQTEQAVINELYGDNRISFLYQGRKITFGENLYSWDYEELEIILYKITGIDLRRKEKYEINDGE